MSNKAVVIGEFEGILAELTAEGKGYWNVSEDKANNTLFCAYVSGKESGNSRIRVRIAILLRIDNHAAEFIDIEWASKTSYAYLLIDNWSVIVALDGDITEQK